jgi:formate dehydrogenase iron-sulfur subunit
MIPTVYISRDAAALAVGADAVAQALQDVCNKRNRECTIVCTGSRGLYWLEPVIEVDAAEGRIAYGPVSSADVPDLVATGLLEARPHPLRLGRLV